MAKVIYPITWLAGYEGEPADVIHDIAEEMMEHRAELLQYAAKIPEGERLAYLKHAGFLEEYSTVLQAIYYQLAPDQWNPDTSGEMLEFAKVNHVSLPDWMLADRNNPTKTSANISQKETAEYAVNRFENEGGRILPEKLETL